LEGRPVVVRSNNDGCLIARSDEAKALGFAMGDPYHLISPWYTTNWKELPVAR
jgi:DNA polymerase V